MRLQCHYLKTFFSGGIDQDFTKSPQGKKKPFVQARMTHEFNFFGFHRIHGLRKSFREIEAK